MGSNDADQFIQTDEESAVVGEYRFHRLIAEGSKTLMWSATQLSVDRQVIIVSLREELLHDASAKAEFISSMRARAKVDHPQIGSILEALLGEGYCYYAMEKLEGENLSHFFDEGELLSPSELAVILQSISEAYLFFESEHIVTAPIAIHDLFIEDKSSICINNLAVEGQYSSRIFDHDKQVIGNIFKNLLLLQQPGATRMGSLLDYMIGSDSEPPLSWSRIAKLAKQVERELKESQIEVKKSIFDDAKVINAIKIGAVIILIVLVVIVIWKI